MLQYILTESDRYSVAELAQMALEGGCLWISIGLPSWSDDSVREAIAPDVIDMCKESGVFLTVDDRPELARELGLHGVRLSRDYLNKHPENSPMALRENLGPEAVIGVEIADPSVVPSLLPADIDFVSLPKSFSSSQRKAFVDALCKMEISLPVVAQGDFTPAQCAEVLNEGCNGIAVEKSITDAGDPVKATEELMALKS